MHDRLLSGAHLGTVADRQVLDDQIGRRWAARLADDGLLQSHATPPALRWGSQSEPILAARWRLRSGGTGPRHGGHRSSSVVSHRTSPLEPPPSDWFAVKNEALGTRADTRRAW